METLYALLAEPLAHDFMQRALLMSILVGVVCSVFSCFLVLKGWSLMGDAVSHAILPGLAIAYILAIPLAIGAFFSGLLCALATGYLKRNSRVKEDAVMGIVFSGMFAFGLVLFTKIETDLHLLHLLFGNVLGITARDMAEASVIAVVCTVAMLAKRRDLLAQCFDPAHAGVIGLPVQLLHFGFLILLALTIVAALKAVGIILVIAMLIAPGAIGFLLASTFDRMLMVAIVASVFSCVAGVLMSYHFDTATAPLIVVIEALLFLSALLVTKLSQDKKRCLLRPREVRPTSSELVGAMPDANQTSK